MKPARVIDAVSDAQNEDVMLPWIGEIKVGHMELSALCTFLPFEKSKLMEEMQKTDPDKDVDLRLVCLKLRLKKKWGRA